MSYHHNPCHNNNCAPPLPPVRVSYSITTAPSVSHNVVPVKEQARLSSLQYSLKVQDSDVGQSLVLSKMSVPQIHLESLQTTGPEGVTVEVKVDGKIVGSGTIRAGKLNLGLDLQVEASDRKSVV